jgi:hypothetical protein
MTAAPLPRHAVDHRSPLLTRAPDDAINRPSGSLVAGAAAGVHGEPAGRPLGAGLSPRTQADDHARSTTPEPPCCGAVPPNLLAQAFRQGQALGACGFVPLQQHHSSDRPALQQGEQTSTGSASSFAAQPLCARLWPARRAKGLHNLLIGYGTNGPVGRPGTGARLGGSARNYPAGFASRANLHAVSMRSPRDLGHSPFISTLAPAFARVGGLITSSHSLSGFGSCCAADRGRGLGC